MHTRQLGKSGPSVSALGLGAMGMSDFYGPADEGESVATLQAALDAGINLIDTGDFYGTGHNEMLISRAIEGRREQAFIQVKFGVLRDPAGGFIGMDLRPEAIKNSLAYTLKRLKTDHVDLYQPARIDPRVPLEDVIGTMADLVQAGYVRHIGLSEAGAATIRKANAIHPVASIQMEYSLISRSIEREILPTTRALGIGVTAYGVLSRGLLSGRVGQEGFDGRRDFRATSPRFIGDNLQSNLKLVDALTAVAAKHQATPAQAAIAWVLSRGDDVVPLIGARRRDRLAESLAALDLELGPDDLGGIEAAVPAGAVAGERYDAQGMAILDSEH